VAGEEENNAKSIMTDALLKYGVMGNSQKKNDQGVLLRFLTKLSLDCDQLFEIYEVLGINSTFDPEFRRNKKYIKQTISRNDPYHRYLGINRRKHYSSQTVSETSTTAAQSHSLQLFLFFLFFFFLFHELYTSLQRPAKP
jgi:hypothetical protein